MVPTPSTIVRAKCFTGMERVILSYLLRSVGQIVSKADLTEAVYPAEEAPSSNVLEVIVSRLRRKLQAAGIGLRITTLRSRGYRIDTTTMPCGHSACVQKHTDTGLIECVQNGRATCRERVCKYVEIM